jgi:NTP pyrophosphatase (non-canonical NTP hydrolase)
MKKLHPLRFDKFNKINTKRCETVYHKINDWSPSDWGNALAGEVGEACNFIKKLRRLEGLSGAKINKKRKRLKEALAKELGDIFHYLDLTATRLDIDLGKAVVDKFNEVSKRTGYDKVFILK